MIGVGLKMKNVMRAKTEVNVVDPVTSDELIDTDFDDENEISDELLDSNYDVIHKNDKFSKEFIEKIERMEKEDSRIIKVDELDNLFL